MNMLISQVPLKTFSIQPDGGSDEDVANSWVWVHIKTPENNPIESALNKTLHLLSFPFWPSMSLLASIIFLAKDKNYINYLQNS